MTAQDSAWQDFLAISKCPYISDEDSGHWQEMLDRADVQTVTALLLTLLPNLRTFFLADFADSSKIVRVVNKIATAHQSGDRIDAQSIPLSKLCFFRASWGNPLAHIGLWDNFAMLPSMRCLRNGPFKREYLERWHSHGSGSSNITEVHFDRACLPIEILRRLCSHIKSLEKFVYNHVRGGIASQGCGTLSDLASLLQTYAGHSLKELCLSIDESDRPNDQFVPNFVGPLQGFEQLEKIEIEFYALVRENAGKLVVPKLADILPASIHELHIWLPNVKKRAIDLMGGLFAGIEEWKQEKLPKIHLVVFRRYRYKGDNVTEIPLDNDTTLTCESCGISFEVRAWPFSPLPTY